MIDADQEAVCERRSKTIVNHMGVFVLDMDIAKQRTSIDMRIAALLLASKYECGICVFV